MLRKIDGAELADAISWIARNDEPTITDAQQLQDLISVQLVADLFGWKPIEIAILVVRLRGEMAEASDPKTWAKLAAKQATAASAR